MTASPGPRHICYVSGTRADFGLMRTTLQAIQTAPDLRLSVIVTGMHLSPRHGGTATEIEAAGLDVAARVEVPLEDATGAAMARNIGTMVIAFTDALERLRPDLVLLLGDRGEMLAGALAAIHLNIPVAHVHGGERSGTIDEPVRHAISKLSHLHFTATAQARQRLIDMGERADRVWATGAPGLDGLSPAPAVDRATLLAEQGLDAARPFALLMLHPVHQEAGQAGEQAEALLDALRGTGLQILALMPNSDAGSAELRAALAAAGGASGFALVTHLPRDRFLAAMAFAEIMVGNSSAGIIEAASFGTPVLNVGRRQHLRERNRNVLDVAADRDAIAQGLAQLLAGGRFAPANLYGDGRAGERIVRLLRETPLDAELLNKVNGY
jgi:GDP/UDP-N,N'-diacetylbacillosamine 2-epimerase (hydrolysing)